jgi:membrane complex biogenesis BtpA family protein
MVHLLALPGSPGYGGDFDRVLAAARADGAALVEAGFPALLVENFGDAPFFTDAVPPVTIAAMTRVVTELRSQLAKPVGINVLRNDARAALAVAAVTGAAFIRVNVLTGAMFTDQGLITGRAAEVGRDRAGLAPGVKILADVFVKHASPPPGLTIEQAGADTWERGGADALIVSGSGTGRPPDLDSGRRLRAAVPEAVILIGSGVDADNLALLAEIADGAIVGSALKEGGRLSQRVERRRAEAVVKSARAVGWL